MFGCAFFGDMLVFRMLIILIMALLKSCVACCMGYRKVQYHSANDIRNLLNSAVKDMFTNNKDY